MKHTGTKILLLFLTIFVHLFSTTKDQKKTNVVIVLMVKNEADVICSTLEPFVNSGFDQFFIYDTGSTDGTQQKVADYFNQHNINNYYIIEEPFINFATSRNNALRLAEKYFSENDFMLMLDAEWYITNPEILLSFCKDKAQDITTQGYFICVHIGNAQFYIPRLLRMHQNVCFKGKVHEIPMIHSGGYLPPEVYVTYAPTKGGQEKSYARWKRDAEILLKEHEENPHDSRTAFYLAQTYDCLNMWDEAFLYYTKRTELEGSMEENALAWYRRAKVAEKLYERTQDQDWKAKAIHSYITSWNMYPYKIEAAVSLAKLLINDHDFKLAYAILKEIYDTPYPSTQHCVLISDKIAYDFTRYELMSIAAWYVDDYEWGKKAAIKALRYNFELSYLHRNLALYVTKLENTTGSYN